MSFHKKLKSIQYNACLAITEARRNISKEKFNQELGLESFQLRRWYRKLGMIYKIFKSKSPLYLFKLIPGKTFSCVTRNADNVRYFNINHNFYKNSFFTSSIIEWNNIDPNLHNFGIFKNNILKFVRPKPNSFFTPAILRELDWSHGSD